MMSFIAQAAQPVVTMPQSENIAIQVLLYVIGGGLAVLAVFGKPIISWVTGMKDAINNQTIKNSSDISELKEAISELKEVIIDQHTKSREQYASESEKKREQYARMEMVLNKVCMKLGSEEAADDLIKRNGGKK